ncbi:MAG: putative metal-binding motif-containing protein [Myxococcota bacterium]
MIRPIAGLAAALLLSCSLSCSLVIDSGQYVNEAVCDEDGDGFVGATPECRDGVDLLELDCDDADPTVFPGADPVCRDGKINNCREVDQNTNPATETGRIAPRLVGRVPPGSDFGVGSSLDPRAPYLLTYIKDDRQAYVARATIEQGGTPGSTAEVMEDPLATFNDMQMGPAIGVVMAPGASEEGDLTNFLGYAGMNDQGFALIARQTPGGFETIVQPRPLRALVAPVALSITAMGPALFVRTRDGAVESVFEAPTVWAAGQASPEPAPYLEAQGRVIARQIGPERFLISDGFSDLELFLDGEAATGTPSFALAAFDELANEIVYLFATPVEGPTSVFAAAIRCAVPETIADCEVLPFELNLPEQTSLVHVVPFGGDTVVVFAAAPRVDARPELRGYAVVLSEDPPLVAPLFDALLTPAELGDDGSVRGVRTSGAGVDGSPVTETRMAFRVARGASSELWVGGIRNCVER